MHNAYVAINHDKYQKRYYALVTWFGKVKTKHIEVTDLIAERMSRKHQNETYPNDLQNQEPLTEFQKTDCPAMVDYITVDNKKHHGDLQ